MLFKKTGKEAENMIRNLGYLAAGVVVGLVVTGMIVNKEIRDQKEREEVIEDGLFAEIQGNTVRLYKVEEGRFCGYHETREFESQEKAVEWVLKETNAKLQFTQ
jgi:hypothetical protein